MAVFVVYAVDVSLQQGGESLVGQIELGDSFGAKQIDFSVLVSRYAQHGVAEKAVGIVLAQFVSLDIIAVVAVQTFARGNPQDAVLIDVQAVDAEL